MNKYEAARALDFSAWTVDEQTYRADDRLNFHTLNNFKKDPAAFKAGFYDDREPTDAMRFGNALHCKLLTPDLYEKNYAVFKAPINPKTGEAYGATSNAYKDARAAFEADNAGKSALTPAAAELVDKLIDTFYFHAAAPHILDNVQVVEQSICGVLSFDYTPDNAVAVKGRIDAYSTTAGLIDVKTTNTLDDGTGRDKFKYALYDYKYLPQLAFYHRILRESYGAPFVPVWFIVFETNPPNRVAVYTPTREILEAAYMTINSWLEQYSGARRFNNYKSKYDLVQVIDTYNPERDI